MASPAAGGCLIIPVLYLMMRSLDETEEFLARKQHFSFSQIIRSVVANWRVVVLGTMFVTSQ